MSKVKHVVIIKDDGNFAVVQGNTAVSKEAQKLIDGNHEL